MLQSSESCLWKQFQKSGEEPEEEEQDHETLKTKKAPLREGPNDSLLEHRFPAPLVYLLSHTLSVVHGLGSSRYC